MKKQIIIMVLGCWFPLVFAQQKSTVPLTAAFDKVLSESFKTNGTGGVALVSRKGQIIYSKAFGMANLELDVPMQVGHVFRIGSITKQFTAIAILQLMESGQLNLQDDITKFIPDYPTQGNTITIEHLLSHTSGIANYTSMKDYREKEVLDITPKEMVDYFKSQPMKFTPGTAWSYSNSNYFLLGYIIEKITGKTYADYLEDHFFKPLGMTHSLYGNDTKLVGNRVHGYTQGDFGFENAKPLSMTQPYAAGAIQSTVGDLFLWHQAVHSYQLVKKETLEKALMPYTLKDGSKTAYGYGWRLGNVYESPSIWHGGLINGFVTMEIYLPKEDVFVTVFSNCDCNSPAVVTSRLAALAAGRPFEYKEITIGNTHLQEYAGVYENEKGLQRVVALLENQLGIQSGRGPKAELKAYQKDQFFLDEIQTITFTRNKGGVVEKLTTQNLNGNEVWNKTTKPIPSANGIRVDSALLETYAGDYEVSPEFVFSIKKEQDRLFLQAPGQEKLEMLAETPTQFFLKVNDAQFEFVKDDLGKIAKVIMNQGGRQANAKKIK